MAHRNDVMALVPNQMEEVFQLQNERAKLLIVEGYNNLRTKSNGSLGCQLAGWWLVGHGNQTTLDS